MARITEVTLEIDEVLLAEAAKALGTTEPSATVREAMREVVEVHKGRSSVPYRGSFRD